MVGISIIRTITKLLLSFICLMSLETYGQFSQIRGYLENKGQIIDQDKHLRKDILFKASERGGDFYIRNNGVSYVLYKFESDQNKSGRFVENREESISGTIKGHRVDIEFVGAQLPQQVEKQKENAYFENYYSPHCSDGIVEVKSFGKVALKEIYPGIEAVHYFNGKYLEYDLILKPGVNPDVIRMKIKGAQRWKINKEGDLVIKTPLGDIVEKAPIVFQGEQQIEAHYKIESGLVTFELGEYNRNKELRIDPIREWATYYGGSAADLGGDLAADTADNVFMHTGTVSINFPVSTGAFQTTYNTSTDACVVKFSDTGNRLWATYYGGSDTEWANGKVATDLNGNVAISGTTNSSNFPVSAGAYQATLSGLQSAYVVKFSPTGQRIWGSYCGSPGTEWGEAITMDGNGNVFISGRTDNTLFPVSNGAFQPNLAGNFDAYLVKFSGAGNYLWGTFYGGGGDDEGRGITTDATGSVYLCGKTKSSNLPVTPGTFQPATGGGQDGFLIKFSSVGVRIWATYFGGSSLDWGESVDADINGNIYMTGSTTSGNLATTPNAFQSNFAGGQDAYLSKFSSTGNLVWSTFYGGSSNEWGNGVVATGGKVFIHGITYSINFPITPSAFQSTNAGGVSDTYLTEFTEDGSRLWASYYGGTGYDLGLGIAGGTRSVYIHGITHSVNFPVSQGAYQTTNAGDRDTYIAKFSVLLIKESGICQNDSIQFSISDTTSVTSVRWNFGDPASGAADSSSLLFPYHIYTTTGQFDVKCVITNVAGADTLKKTITIYPKPDVDLGPDTVLCAGDSLELQLSDTTFSYLWNTGSTTLKAVVSQPDTYWVNVLSYCGAFSDTIVIDSIVSYDVKLPPDTIMCQGDSLMLDASILNGSYQWSTSPTDTNATFTVQSTGSYSVTATNGCGTGSDTIEVEYIAAPQINFAEDTTLCSGDTLKLILTDTINHYLWENGDTSLTRALTTAGIYWVKATNKCGVQIDSIQLKIVAPPVVSLGNDTLLCSGDSLVLAPVVAWDSISWSTGATDTTLTIKTTGVYWGKVYNLCGDFTDSIEVKVDSLPVITSSITDTIICRGEVYAVKVNQSNSTSIVWTDYSGSDYQRALTSGGMYQYSLVNQCGTIRDSFSLQVESPAEFSLGADTTICFGEKINMLFSFPNHTYLWGDGSTDSFKIIVDKGLYNLTITSPAGCESNDEVKVKSCNDGLFVPNAFSPGNGDGINDKFVVKGEGIEHYRIHIYDRWGNQVFATNDLTHSWDGMYKNQLAAEGVYVYKIWYGTELTSATKYGSVLLLRR